MRLINADELKEWVENWFEKNRYYHPHSKANNIPIPELYDILERMPTVEAEPIRHGEWLMDDESGDIKCSCCGHWSFDMYDEIEIVDGKKIIITTMPHYCGYCGAKMDDAPTQKSVGKALETLEANDDIR